MAEGLDFDFDETEPFNITATHHRGGEVTATTNHPGATFESDIKQHCNQLISKVNSEAERLKVEERNLEMSQCLLNEKLQGVNEQMSQYKKSLDEDYRAKCKILEEKQLQLDNLKEEQEKLFENKLKDFEDEKEKMKKVYEIQQGIIKLDVGGNHFTTSLKTLSRDSNSMIAVMFSGRHNLFKSDDGSYFIDRDGTYFQYILNYLRGGIISPEDLPEDTVLLNALRREADFYQICGFSELLDECLGIPSEKVDYSQEEITKMMSTLVRGDVSNHHVNNINDFTDNGDSNPNFSLGRSHFVSQSMTKCKLNFTNKKMNGISFAHTTFFHDVSFRNARLVGASFYGCEFGVGVHINFNYADLSDCDFRQCKGKENGAKMTFAHGTPCGGLLSASSSDTFLQMVQEGRISFKRAKIENALFDPKVSAFLNDGN